MRDVRTVDFFRLPPSTRERFVGCIGGAAPPAPLLRTVPKLGTIVFWRVVLAAGAVAGLGWLGYNGFGECWDRWMIQSPFVLVLYAGLLGLGALAVLGAARAVILRRTLPFPPGKYLFPLDLVDAPTRDLRVLPLAALQSTRAVEHFNEGAYTHTAFEFLYEGGEKHTFSINNQLAAVAAAQTIDASRAALRDAIDRQDVQAVANLDVFFEPRASGSWQVEPAAGEPPPAKLPFFLARWRLAAAVAGIVVAVPLWHLRNVRSDDAGFVEAIAWENAGGPGFDSYLRRGKRHVDKVRRTFLPRAEIRKALQAGSLRDLDLLAERHRGAPLEAEVREARRQVLTELAMKADRTKDLRALRDFLRDHPGSHVDGHVRSAIARLYDLAKARYREVASTEPNVASFMEKLLDRLAATGSPEVPVRFERRVKGLRDDLDAAAWRSKEESLVGQIMLTWKLVLARDLDLFAELRHDAGAPVSSPQPTVTVVYDVEPARFGEKYSFVVTMEVPGTDGAKVSFTQAGPRGGTTVATRADAAFHTVELFLAQQLFKPRAMLVGRREALGTPAAPPSLPVRVPAMRFPSTGLPWGTRAR